MDIGNIVSIITTLIAVTTVFIAWRKLKPEYQGLDADAATKYAELVDRAAKRECEYQNRIDEITLDVEKLNHRVSEMATEIRTANVRADKFEGWAKRLAHQVQALNAIPVPLDPELAK